MRTIRTPLTPVIAALVSLMLAACGGADDDSESTVPDATSTNVPTVVDGQLAVAIADLVERIGVDEDNIYLRSHDAVTWPDGSIGCPQPGMGYTEALVEGVQIILEVDRQTYAYHAAGDADPSYCEHPVDPVGQS